MTRAAGLLAAIPPVAGLLAGSALYAEMPFRVYIEEQDEAQEFVVIEALDVSRDCRFWSDHRRITVHARVLEVRRSAAGLKPGQTIELRYTHRTPPGGDWVGPSPIPVLREGSRTPAFLNRDRSEDAKSAAPARFVPAAGGYSFEPLDDFREE